MGTRWVVHQLEACLLMPVIINIKDEIKSNLLVAHWSQLAISLKVSYSSSWIISSYVTSCHFLLLSFGRFQLYGYNPWVSQCAMKKDWCLAWFVIQKSLVLCFAMPLNIWFTWLTIVFIVCNPLTVTNIFYHPHFKTILIAQQNKWTSACQCKHIYAWLQSLHLFAFNWHNQPYQLGGL